MECVVVELVYIFDEKSTKRLKKSKSTDKVPFKLFFGYIINGGFIIYCFKNHIAHARSGLCYSLRKEWLCLTTASSFLPFS